MSKVLKNHLIQLLENERRLEDPDPGLVRILSFAAAKEELRIATKYIEDLNPHAEVNIHSALDLILGAGDGLAPGTIPGSSDSVVSPPWAAIEFLLNSW